MNNTKNANGTAAKNEATNTKDAVNGSAVLKAITEGKTEIKMDLPENPVQKRLKNLHQCNVLSEKRKSLIDTQDVLREFEVNLDGESDQITLTNKRKGTVPVKKPDAVKKVVELLKGIVETHLEETDKELLSITL